MSLITKASKGSEITIEEADANFAYLETQKSVVPIVSLLSGLPTYISGEIQTFNISNYNANSYYLANLLGGLPTPDGGGNFDVIPEGDGFNLLVIDEGKIPAMSTSFLIEHQEYIEDKAPLILYGTDDGVTATATDNGLANTVNWTQAENSIYLGFILKWTIAKSQYYLASSSSNSRIYFAWEEVSIPSKVWVVDDLQDTSTIYDVNNIQTTADPKILDILGDASCIELWNFDVADGIYNNWDNTNPFIGTGFLTGVGKYGDSARPWQYFNSGATATDPVPWSGNVPMTISCFMKHTSTNPSSLGAMVRIGTDATRYNFEMMVQSTGSACHVRAYIHKRAQTIDVGTFPLGTYACVQMVYSAGTWSFYFDNVLKGTLTLNANWNDSKDVEVKTSDAFNGSFAYEGAGNIDSLRFFNKALNSTERQVVVDAGQRYLDLVPPLVGTPTDVVYGTPPEEILLNGVPEISTITLETDGVDTNVYSYTKTKVDINDAYDIEASFLNGEIGYNTEITGYLEYTKPKN